MSPALTLAVLVVLMAGSITEPRPGDRTPSQLAARIAAASLSRRLGWLAAVCVAAPLYAALIATRTALWLALAGLSWTACALTTLLAMDGRAVRMARMAGGRA
ncbi:hypothetical protein [Streptosporangium sandarakinum]|uniref:hypothetical protein n=1 Tax=Streptosporangium sandarakinum TaxID=1260955 RepID=UPI003711CC27